MHTLWISNKMKEIDNLTISYKQKVIKVILCVAILGWLLDENKSTHSVTPQVIEKLMLN